MKTLLIVFVIALSRTLCVQAEPVSKEKARNLAVVWYKHIAPSSVNDYTVEADHAEDFENLITFYTFEFQSGGFVIVAADDASLPVLGYSEENPFAPEVTCPAVRDWLDDYSRQITQIIKTGKSNTATLAYWEDIQNGIFPPSTKDVNPLLTTHWDQGCYYNELCPVDPAGPCGHAVTGCVATAMAQVMKYHNYPPQGASTHSYPCPVYGTQTADFGNTFYDWASMPDNVTTSNIPVATLMYHAGVSVDMIYGVVNGSGAFVPFVPVALVEYFNYHPEIQAAYMNDYPDPGVWKNLLRNDLDEQLPILYNGFGPAGGHLFVCDGYRMSDEKFHFNWGWSGSYDGWYAIGALNPGITLNLCNLAILQIKPYNSEISVRITEPQNNAVVEPGTLVTIHAETVYGIPDQMKITIEGNVVATGSTGTLSYTWNTMATDVGSHDVRVWAIDNNDSVFHRINLNISDEWIEQSSSFQTPIRGITWMHAVDSNIVWAVVRDGIDEWGAPVQEFTRTLNGGETWTSGIMTGCEGLGCAMVYAMSETKAYIPMFRYYGNNPRGIYVTTDSGVTWNRQVTASFSNANSFPDCIHFFNENEGWCMGDPIPQNGALEFEIYTTTDGGVNWITVPAGNKPNPLTQEYAILSYSAVNDTIWFGTTKGRVYKSTDKGHNWTVSAVPDMAGDWITPVFRNGSHGLVHNFFNFGDLIIYDDATICETFDGGETWTSVTTTGPMYWTDIAFIRGTENTWVSTGGRRELAGKGASFSTDGGHSWTAFPGTEGANFRFMSWISNECGWAGSYNLNDTVGGIFKFIGELPTNPSTTVNKHPVKDLKNLIIWPNPSNDKVTISASSFLKNANVALYNVSGEKILETQLTDTETQIDISALPRGVYFVRVQDEKMVEVRKMVKE